MVKQELEHAWTPVGMALEEIFKLASTCLSKYKVNFMVHWCKTQLQQLEELRGLPKGPNLQGIIFKSLWP